MSTVWPDRISVVGTPISATSSEEVLELLGSRPLDKATVIAFCNVHSVMTARHDTDVAAALLDADIAAPDGVPVVWGLRAAGCTAQGRVDGPSFMQRALEHGVAHGWRHFFCGSTEETLGKLVEATERIAPGAIVVGTYSPPFRPPTDEDLRLAADKINEAGADLVWVGLGMPKQELWMRSIRHMVPGMALLGVGAAFDFIAGTTPRAPTWMQSAGLEWLHRLSRQPRKMWRRYLFNNPAYLILLTRDIVRGKRVRRQTG
ncbi:MAG: WecB/TagA/CpsF family glycosyltransferase [Gammaproteobacteria bacterium]|nr:WecB/TagA/CpsF family glycosyltransferase [Gammaproteobacteria bacterium]